MGEQPNPWDRLQPQDATSRHRTFSAVSSSADYIFTLLDESEGSACCDSHKFADLARTATVAIATVVTGSISQMRRLPTVLPTTNWWLGVHRYKPILRRHFCRLTPN